MSITSQAITLVSCFVIGLIGLGFYAIYRYQSCKDLPCDHFHSHHERREG